MRWSVLLTAAVLSVAVSIGLLLAGYSGMVASVGALLTFEVVIAVIALVLWRLGVPTASYGFEYVRWWRRKR